MNTKRIYLVKEGLREWLDLLVEELYVFFWRYYIYRGL